MAATKVMKFWAVCLAVLGKLLASLGVSAAASAARRDAVLYERTLGKANEGTDAPAADAPGSGDPGSGDPGSGVPAAVHCAAPDGDPDAGTRTVPAARAVPTVPAPRAVPHYGQTWPARRMFARPELPPTIKQRISAEAHGASPGLRSRVTRGIDPLCDAPAAPPAPDAPVAPASPAAPAAPAGAASHTSSSDMDARSARIPAARSRAHTARTV